MHDFSSVLRIVQISDCHVGADSSADYRGQNADRNLISLLPAIRRWQPNHILLTGDVSEDGSAASYGRVTALLNSLGAPVLALPGNHDKANVMSRYFPRGPWSGPYAEEHKGWQMLLLDSTLKRQIHGVLSGKTLERLDQLLQGNESRNTLVALHHQPLQVGSPWIDRYALRFADAFQAVLDRHAAVKVVTWGHVHQDYCSSRDSMTLLGSPSSVANSLPGTQKFTIDMKGPACRWLELSVDGSIETGLLYAD